MTVTSVRGHLLESDFPMQYGWKNCPPIALFDAPINKVNKVVKDITIRMSAYASISLLRPNIHRITRKLRAISAPKLEVHRRS